MSARGGATRKWKEIVVGWTVRCDAWIGLEKMINVDLEHAGMGT